MPETLLYVVGGIITGLLVFTIAYNFITSSIIQAQQQEFLSSFNELHSNIEFVCLRELNNTMNFKIKIPVSLRVLYATNDKSPLVTVTDLITNQETSEGTFLCYQFKHEQKPRCEHLTCNTMIPYLGAFETYNDIQLMVKKILGEPLIKEQFVSARKTENGVEIKLE